MPTSWLPATWRRAAPGPRVAAGMRLERLQADWPALPPLADWRLARRRPPAGPATLPALLDAEKRKSAAGGPLAAAAMLGRLSTALSGKALKSQCLAPTRSAAPCCAATNGISP
jgi:hypothetical protein